MTNNPSPSSFKQFLIEVPAALLNELVVVLLRLLQILREGQEAQNLII